MSEETVPHEERGLLEPEKEQDMKSGYVIISPVRNEAAFLPAAINAVAAQTMRPKTWFLVDDGSSDGTDRIAAEAASRFEWIHVVNRSDRGARVAGTGVMEAFYEAYSLLGEAPWEYLVKLDADVSFSSDYFERCFSEFHADPRLGIASGLVCVQQNAECFAEYQDPEFHVRGPAKIYRRECWQDIGGLAIAPGWDTLDLVKANMLGWMTRTFQDIRLIHHRPTGNAYGAWSNWKKNGVANYMVGYHPLFMVAKCARRMVRKPYGIAALGLLSGFCAGYLKRMRRAADSETMQYLRKQQIRSLLGAPSLWTQGRNNFQGTDAVRG